MPLKRRITANGKCQATTKAGRRCAAPAINEKWNRNLRECLAMPVPFYCLGSSLMGVRWSFAMCRTCVDLSD